MANIEAALAAQRNRLKKASTVEKKADLVSQAESLVQFETIRAKVTECDIENWYEPLREWTYPTVFDPISIEEGKAMVRHFEHKPVPTDSALIAQMTSRLQGVINSLPARSAFIKLSSRCAKDAATASSRTEELLREFLAPHRTSSSISMNTILQGLMTAHIEALKVSDASVCVRMMLESERIYNDLVTALEHPEKWKQNFVLRDWVPIPIGLEIRGFVMNNSLTALSQYYHYCYWPILAENKLRVLNMVRNFFETVKNVVPVADKCYVIDFAVDLEHDKVMIVELNPFGEFIGMGTSTALFNIKEEHDREILFGRAPFEYRIEEAPRSDDQIWSLMGSNFCAIVKKENLRR
ncbi:cell division cycle protein 123-like [Pelomyxa schiedti]|nr:cell division cycle protein 123-like [Pelomyxa schiedti]